MANVKSLAAALGLAGALLVPASASFAQTYVRQAVVAPVMVDCYYDIVGACGPNGYAGGYAAYGAIGPINGGPYAAIGVAGPGFARPGIYGFGRLSATDLVGVFGANSQ
jgi:hypothetical protein